MLWSQRCFAVIAVACCLATLPLNLARVCDTASKYCSVGKVQGYIGPLDSVAQLKEALERASHEREVIVVSDTRVHDAAQALARFREAGWGHVLAVMERPIQCQQLQAAFEPWLASEGAISCGTYATTDESGTEYPAGFKYLARAVGQTAWWRKWFTTGRAVALQYNVMAVDTDVVVLGDWYWRVKQPPLNQFKMLSQSEGLIEFNGGFSYIQNASSNGPVAWVLYEAMHRAVRWAEDDAKLREASAIYRERRGRRLELDDQLMLRDCLFSAAFGRPVFPSLLWLLRDDDEAVRRMMNASRVWVHSTIYVPLYSVWRSEMMYTVTGELLDSVCEHYTDPACRTTSSGSVTISTAMLQMPYTRGEWPPILGGYPFNSTPGPYTSAYREAYKELGVALPPDPEDPAMAAVAEKMDLERFGYLAVPDRRRNRCSGCWAEAGWFATGRHGWWHRHLLTESQRRKTAMGHIWSGLFPGDYKKEMVLMLSGLYNWQVAARFAGSMPRLYLANQGFPTDDPHRIMPPIFRAVVAFAPGVIHAAMSKADFVRAAQGLAQVAVSLGAIAAWPAAPCDSEWALTPEARASAPRPLHHAIPWTHLDTFHTVQPFGDSLAELQCEWPGFAAADCITSRDARTVGGRGMLAVEFHHLRNSTQVSPSSQTTLRFEESGVEALPPPGNTARQPVLYADLVRINVHLVFSRLQREQMPVFWLDRLVEVTDMAAEAADTYKRWHGRCMGLRYLEMPERERERW